MRNVFISIYEKYKKFESSYLIEKLTAFFIKIIL